jgi:hypothetical protein
VNIDQDTVAESIEDVTTSDDSHHQEEELEALIEAVEKEISESPPDPEESEVIAKMAEAVQTGASLILFVLKLSSLTKPASSQNPPSKAQKVNTVTSNLHVPRKHAFPTKFSILTMTMGFDKLTFRNTKIRRLQSHPTSDGQKPGTNYSLHRR